MNKNIFQKQKNWTCFFLVSNICSQFSICIWLFLSQRKSVAFSAQIHPYINCRDKSHVISLNLSSFFPWIICIFHITSIHFIVSFDFGIIFFVSKRKNKQTNKNNNYHTKYKSMISLCAIFVFYLFRFSFSLSLYLSVYLCLSFFCCKLHLIFLLIQYKLFTWIRTLDVRFFLLIYISSLLYKRKLNCFFLCVILIA